MVTIEMRGEQQSIRYDVADTEDFYNTRTPSSTRRYKIYDKGAGSLSMDDDTTIEEGVFVQRRASRNGQGITSNAVNPSRQMRRAGRSGLASDRGTRRFSAVLLMLGAITTVILIMLVSALISWWQGVMDNVHYGYPRISQLDAVVGHNDSTTHPTHFIFLNLRGHIQVIEIPGGDASHPRVLPGPTLIGAGQDLIPVTGEIRDEDGRHNLVVHIQSQQIVYINDGSTFHQQ